LKSFSNGTALKIIFQAESSAKNSAEGRGGFQQK